MFEATRMMYLYVETPLHVGTGRSMGAVDLPIQRERVTGYPMIQSSSIKGQLRSIARSRLTTADLKTVFGPEIDASEHAGSLAPGDAKLLLFPIRSLSGVYAWTTSIEILARFKRDLAMVGVTAVPSWELPTAIDPSRVAVCDNLLVANGKVVLEEFAFDPDQAHAKLIGQIGEWIASNGLPLTPEYEYWRKQLPSRLAILDNDTFRDFTQFATEVQTHVRLKPETKTVDAGALWTEESLPVDSLLYVPLSATPARDDTNLSGKQVLGKIAGLGIQRMQLGGDETTGRGIVHVRL